MTGHKRGELEVRQFSEAIIQTLNNEQNRDKGDWSNLAHGEILEGLMAEVSELTGEMAYSIPDWQRVSEEALDVAAYALFAWEKARKRVKEIEQVERVKRDRRGM